MRKKTFSALLKVVDGNDRLLLMNIKSKGEVFRDHCWSQLDNFKRNIAKAIIRSGRNKDRYYFFATEYSYSVVKKSIVNINYFNTKDNIMKDVVRVDANRRDKEITITYYFLHNKNIELAEELLLDELDDYKDGISELKIQDTKLFINGNTIKLIFICDYLLTAKRLKRRLVDNINSNKTLDLKKLVNQNQNVERIETACETEEDCKVVIKYPKSARALKQYSDISSITVGENVFIARELIEDIPLNTNEITVVKIKKGDSIHYVSKNWINIPSQIIKEIHISLMAEVVSKPVLEIENFKGIEDGCIVSVINGKEIKVEDSLIKRDGEVFEIVKFEDKYYELEDVERKTPIPVDILNIRTVRKTK